MDNLASKKVADLKAPMPGLVLDVSVEVGQEVAKGGTLLILLFEIAFVCRNCLSQKNKQFD